MESDSEFRVPVMANVAGARCTRLYATCTSCGEQFVLASGLCGEPEGVLLERAPVCFRCLPAAAAEIESGAQPMKTVHR